MADTLTTWIRASLGWAFKETLADASTVNDIGTLEYTLSMPDGVTDASSQSDKIWHWKNATLSTNETFDLSALTNTVFGATVTIAFVEVTGIFIKNNNTSATNILIVGAAAANAWEAPWGGTGPTIKVPPNGIWMQTNPLGTAWTVNGTNKNLKIAAGAGTISYNIVIVGRSA